MVLTFENLIFHIKYTFHTMDQRHRVRMLLFRLVQDLCSVHSDALGEPQLTQLLNLLSNSTTSSGSSVGHAPAGSTREQLKMMQEEWAEASRSELRFMLRIFRQATPEPEPYLEARLMDRVVDVFSTYTAPERLGGGGAHSAAPGQVAATGGEAGWGETEDQQSKIVLGPTVVVILEGLLALQQQVCVCVCVCLLARACAYVCVCVCVFVHIYMYAYVLVLSSFSIAFLLLKDRSYM